MCKNGRHKTSFRIDKVLQSCLTISKAGQRVFPWKRDAHVSLNFKELLSNGCQRKIQKISYLATQFWSTAARALLGNSKVSSQAKTFSWALVYIVISHFQQFWKKSIDGPLRKLSFKIFYSLFLKKGTFGSKYQNFWLFKIEQM